MTNKLEELMKVNKHLNIALSLLNNPSLYVGVLRDSRKLIKLKLKLEHLIESTSKQEIRDKQRFFNKLK